MHDLAEGHVMSHPGGVGRILLRVLVGLVGSNLGRNVIPDAAGDTVGVGKQRAEMVIEGL
ncbi:MAG: hypothetical protein WCO56_13595 [Verrucomicrobiota bacterium]